MVDIYDWPKIGPLLRRLKYKKAFDSLSPGEVAIDCGANVGKVTKRMARPGVEVYAFEPDPSAYKALVKNMEGLDGVMCINKAVSSYNGMARIYFNNRYSENPEKWSTASTLLEDKPNVDKKNYADCEVIDLAEFISGIKKPIGLLKMDIEGEEVKVLNKLIDMELTDRIRKIVVETHERFPTLAEPTRNLKRRIRESKIRNIDLNWA